MPALVDAGKLLTKLAKDWGATVLATVAMLSKGAKLAGLVGPS